MFVITQFLQALRGLWVVAFGALVALLILVQVLQAVDWLWFLPDGPWSNLMGVEAPPPARAGPSCITMPDGTKVCEGNAPSPSNGGF
ncbi:MAG: hypothetical protein H6907_09965 [Hyphomicrobiales bacterium]|nr:hypothetical protein [Hyphomicrobiales bacterium]MCP5372044.1 hypothetical protein [Hyphomicrobiales bacterium]